MKTYNINFDMRDCTITEGDEKNTTIYVKHRFDERTVELEDAMTTEEAAAAIVEFAEKNDGSFAVRSDDRVYKIGDRVSRSHDWDYENDVQSDDLLDGTCGTGISTLWTKDFDEVHEALLKALAQNATDYYGPYLYIIAGDLCDYGNDENEWIIGGAEVVAVIGKIKSKKR